MMLTIMVNMLILVNNGWQCSILMFNDGLFNDGSEYFSYFFTMVNDGGQQ